MISNIIYIVIYESGVCYFFFGVVGMDGMGY